MRDGYAEWVWGLYGFGDEAGELHDSGDGDFRGECGDDEGSGDGDGRVVVPRHLNGKKQIPPAALRNDKQKNRRRQKQQGGLWTAECLRSHPSQSARRMGHPAGLWQWFRMRRFGQNAGVLPLRQAQGQNDNFYFETGSKGREAALWAATLCFSADEVRRRCRVALWCRLRGRWLACRLRCGC